MLAAAGSSVVVGPLSGTSKAGVLLALDKVRKLFCMYYFTRIFWQSTS